MNDNDILIARKTENGSRSVVIDGDAADCERQNRRVKERQAAEAAKRKQEAECARMRQMEKEAAERAEYAKRRNRVQLGVAMFASVAALVAMTLTGLIHNVVGMAFIAGDAAAFGWMLGRVS